MFWSDQGLHPKIAKIEQANMDGSARAVLVNSGLVGVNSLAIDYSGKLLYWCDASLDRIERIDFQGNNRIVILDLSSGTWHPFGLALSDDVLYWSDLEKKNINKYNMTSSLSEVLVHGMGSPKELHVHDDGKIFSVLFQSPVVPFCLCPRTEAQDPVLICPEILVSFPVTKGTSLGSATRTCRNDGTWTGTQTQCN
ncbi:Low-density lipoprotein receptor-related protein 4, partial [Stylophora pistillata]